MREEFRSFINQVPSDIYLRTKSYAARDLIVFRPPSYLTGKDIYVDDYHVFLPTSDPPPIYVERKEYQLKKGRMVVFTPQTVMRCMVNAPTRQYISVCINKKFLQDIAQEVAGKINISFPGMNNPYTSKLLYLISNFEEEVQQCKEGNRLMLDSLSTQITVQVLRDSGMENCAAGKKLADGNNYTKTAIEYMVAFFNANIRIDDICKQIHISPYYFIRLFKDMTGKSPHEFLLSVRVEKAEEMLRKGSYTVEEAAKFCGFASTSHFSSCYKKIRGITPSEYKRKYFT